MSQSGTVHSFLVWPRKLIAALCVLAAGAGCTSLAARRVPPNPEVAAATVRDDRPTCSTDLFGSSARYARLP